MISRCPSVVMVSDVSASVSSMPGIGRSMISANLLPSTYYAPHRAAHRASAGRAMTGPPMTAVETREFLRRAQPLMPDADRGRTGGVPGRESGGRQVFQPAPVDLSHAAGFRDDPHYHSMETGKQAHRCRLRAYRQREREGCVTHQGASSVKVPPPSRANLSRRAVCGRHSRWNGPFDRLPGRWLRRTPGATAARIELRSCPESHHGEQEEGQGCRGRQQPR